MNNKNHTRKHPVNRIIQGLLCIFAMTACSDYLDVEPKDKLEGSQVYRDVYDADAAVIGIYGKFMGLAEKYVILNEVRADLLSVTNNADMYLRQLEDHNVNPENPYASPRDFYEVIQNCNDALKNFDSMLSGKKMTGLEYNERYSDIGALRSWLYLQLGIQYGEVPYITEPVENIDDLRDIKKYPRISFEELLTELIDFMEALPYTDPYNPESSLTVDVDGYNTTKFFINKECFLGDLNLWKGNYTQAATHYKAVMETGSGSGNDSERFDLYRVRNPYPNDEDLAVEYIRYQEQDAYSLINSADDGWGSMYSREQDFLWNTEWIWSLPFNSNFAPENPFINLFSRQSGAYLLKPSLYAINLWDSQTQGNGFPYDARGKKFSYFDAGGGPEVKKYLYQYLDLETLAPIDLFQKDGKWYLYRAAKLHLRYAEAANRDNRHKLADALLNFGIRSAYTVEGETDKTDIEQTHDAPPYDFDARQGDFPFYRGNWYRNGGIRGRAYLERAEVSGDSLISIENNIIREAALELAFEGNRWPDLVRIALRRNDPSFLADKIYQKLQKEGNPNAAQVRSRLMDKANWYLPFNWGE